MCKKNYPHIAFVTKCLFKYFILILFCFCTYKNIKAQQFNNWVFPQNNGLSFNNSNLTYFPNTLNNAFYGYSCASISNRNGQLLFYSDGVRVWNKNNQMMPAGFDLLGDDGQVNTALIIPFVNDTNKYYLVTSKGFTNYIPNSQSTLPYSYSIIDMQLNGGLGDVVNKNTLIRYFSSEKMVAIPNANGNDIWWICRDWTNHFYSYKITCQGFQINNPVISIVGTNTNNSSFLIGQGDLKASPDGKYIAISYSTYVEIYEFDKITGALSNPILIPSNYASYGVEFSPNSKMLYITGAEVNSGNGVYIKQVSLSNYNVAAIIASSYTVSNIFGSGGLQLGPDNKIYNNDGGEAVDVINNPNVQGVGCNFQDSVIVLPNPVFRRFPYSYVNLITAQNVQISYTVAANCRTVTFTGKTFIKGNNLSYKWKFTPTDSLTQVVPSMGDTTIASTSFTFPPGQDTFFVNLGVNSDTVCGTGRAGVKVILKLPKPTANFTYATTCNNLSVAFTNTSLPANNPSATYQYAYKLATAPTPSYTNFSTIPNNSYTFNSYDSFDVRLIVTNPQSCITNDTIVKRILPGAKPTAGFTIQNTCGSLQVTLTSTASGTATQEYYFGNILLGTGTNVSYTFPAYGSYIIKHVIKNSATCISDTVKKTIVLQNLQIFTTPSIDTSTSVGLPIQLAVSGAATYTWLPSTNLNNSTTANPIFTANTVGVFPINVEGTNAQGCKANKNIQVKVIAGNSNIWIPSAFTPNKDNLNDRLRPICSGLQSLGNFSIYNRYGELVYTQNNFNATGWDGTYKGKLQPQGVYVYTWAGVKFNGEIVNGKGTVMLLQ